LIITIKKKLQLIFKNAGYQLFFLFYGKIKGILGSGHDNEISVKKVYSDEKIGYKIYSINKGRIYTDTVTDTAFILNQKIIEGPSFQYRNTKREKCEKNIVFQKGTPRVMQKLNGTLFSLLTGGGGNDNYFHWMFDVLPRLGILEKHYSLKEIDFFLLPNISKKFQVETLDILDIAKNKRLSSKNYRHVKAKKVITVDHPYVLEDDLSYAIQNIPKWITSWLREKFLNNQVDSKKLFSSKFYIDRKDSTSNTKNLRKIINEDQVKEILKKNGYASIVLANLSMLEQINIFKNATNIVGLHGAGFANLPFCPPKTKVLEIKPFTAGVMYSNIAKVSNLDYDDIPVKPMKFDNSDQYGHLEVPLDILKEKLNKL
jgi:capsular polysaccharide biosynthesis protein